MSLDQYPRIQVEQTPEGFVIRHSYEGRVWSDQQVYASLSDLEREWRDSVRTIWIEDDDREGNETAYTYEFLLEVRTIFGQGTFPHRELIKMGIIHLLRERGGEVKITQGNWNIYDELAERFQLSYSERQRETSTGENAWRATVGYERENLKRQGIIVSTEVSGSGYWQLAPGI